MRKGTLFFLMLFSGMAMLAQAPQAISYQAVARNSQGEPIKNQQISVQIKIIEGNPLISSRPDYIQNHTVYTETHSIQTNSLGLFSLFI